MSTHEHVNTPGAPKVTEVEKEAVFHKSTGFPKDATAAPAPVETFPPVRYALPAEFVDRQGRVVMAFGEDGTFRLNDPNTGLPRLEFGPYEVPDGVMNAYDNTETHVGLWVFDQYGNRVGGLASMEFFHRPEDKEPRQGYGSVVLFGDNPIPAVELRGWTKGEGELNLHAPTEDCPGHIGASLRGIRGGGGLELHKNFRMSLADGEVRNISLPISFGETDQ